MNNEIILQGVSLSDIKQAVREVLREEMEEKQEPKPLTKAEAARMLKISRQAVYNRMKKIGMEQVTNVNIEQLK